MKLRLLYTILLIAITSNLFSQKKNSKIEKTVVIEETFLPLISKSDSAHSIKALTRDIDNIIQRGGLNNTDYSVAVYSLDEGKFLYKKNENKSLTPASTTKLVTSFVVLNLLKKQQIHTPIYHNGKIEKNTLYGDLIIYGKGDPLLSQRDFDSIAVVIKNRGIKTVTGNIYVDDSYFDDNTSRFKYSRDADEVEALAPITPLSIERNKALVTVRGGSSGSYLDCDVYPNSESLKYLVYGKTTGYLEEKEKGNRNYVEPLVKQQYGDAFNFEDTDNDAYRVSISSSMNDENEQIFIIRGNLRKGRSRAYRYYLKDPAIATAGVLKSSLSKAGVKVLGGIEKCSENQKSFDSKNTLGIIKRDLFEVLDVLNKNSDNYIAENLFKIIGAHNPLFDDNYYGAQDLTYKILKNQKIPSKGLYINDGSGLSRRNLVTTEALVKIIENISKQSYGERFIQCLAIAGSDGTLRKRMKNTAAEDILIGKTGTLRNVSALTGVTTTLDGEKLAYAFIFNGNNVGKYKSVENELGELISQFFYFNEEH
ncbi:MAG: D-alanyl-D-alanine carboxypeptidase/D-alanyl-D-alanine-endopeptidase [Candidatus Kapaibacterium sp.]